LYRSLPQNQYWRLYFGIVGYGVMKAYFILVEGESSYAVESSVMLAPERSSRFVLP
jgi:hypothetical protein